MEAKELVVDLIDEGYPAESIYVIADQDAANELDDLGIRIENYDYTSGNDETVWQRIKDFFGFESKKYDGDLAMYRDSLRNGDILVLVDDSYAPIATDTIVDYANTDTAVQQADAPVAQKEADWNMDMDKDWKNDTLRLSEERMDVNKQQVKSGEVVVHKRIVEDVKTVEVPVRHEEVIIERHAIKDGDATGVDFKDETITIPVMEEQVEVTKHPVVTEEIRIRKQDVEKDQEFSTTLRKEKLDVEKTGDAVIMDEDKVLQP